MSVEVLSDQHQRITQACLERGTDRREKESWKNVRLERTLLPQEGTQGILRREITYEKERLGKTTARGQRDTKIENLSCCQNCKSLHHYSMT